MSQVQNEYLWNYCLFVAPIQKPLKQQKGLDGLLSSTGGVTATDKEEGPFENLLEPGTPIKKNDFKVAKLIGRGGSGKIYMVKKNSNQDVYVLKTLHLDFMEKRTLMIQTEGKKAFS